MVHHDTVNQQKSLMPFRFFPRVLVQTNGIAVYHHSAEPLALP